MNITLTSQTKLSAMILEPSEIEAWDCTQHHGPQQREERGLGEREGGRKWGQRAYAMKADPKKLPSSIHSLSLLNPDPSFV